MVHALKTTGILIALCLTLGTGAVVAEAVGVWLFTL